MNWYKKAKTDLITINKFLSLFRPSSLKGLAAEALKNISFEDFEKDFIGEIKHGTYWHITDNPNFQIDLEKGPRDLSSMNPDFEKIDKGMLMITTHLENWIPYFSKRLYVAEIDMSQVDKKDYHQVKRGFGNEFIVTNPSKARVVQVLPIVKALRLDRYRHNKLPQNQESLEEFFNKIHEQYNEFLKWNKKYELV
jgi:hypothetical protein